MDININKIKHFMIMVFWGTNIECYDIQYLKLANAVIMEDDFKHIVYKQ